MGLKFVKLHYMDIDSLIPLIYKYYSYQDIADDVGEWFDLLNYDQKRRARLLPVGKNQKVVGLKKDERRSKIITNLQQLHQRHILIKCKKYEICKNPEMESSELIKSEAVKCLNLNS